MITPANPRAPRQDDPPYQQGEPVALFIPCYIDQFYPEIGEATARLLERGVAMPYAYRLLHSPTLAHGFNYSVLYLDLDRKGFPYPIIPLHVNCYGSSVISAGGAFKHLFEEPVQNGLPDPSVTVLASSSGGRNVWLSRENQLDDGD